MRLAPGSKRIKPWFIAVSCMVGLPVLVYQLWSPGTEITDGRHDQGANGLWMSHRWLGDDAWFKRNQREALREQYRDPAYIDKTLSMLDERGIADLFPHLAPTSISGKLPGADVAQVERFLDAAEERDMRVMPWVGGVFESHCFPADAGWRHRFIASITRLLKDHPRLAGVHLNIEPWPSGNADGLLLLDELRLAIPKDKLLSVAAYPPPTRWQPTPEVHWDEGYFREVARRCDQLAVMMYDTAVPLEKPYTLLMQQWTREVLAWSGGTPVLLGLPCYSDAAVDYHNPKVENLPNALRGIHAGLKHPRPAGPYQGVALYALWEIDRSEWQAYDTHFRDNRRD